MRHRIKNVWIENKWYFLLSSFLLVLGILFGYFFPESVEDFAKTMLSKIRDLAAKIKESDSGSVAFGIIFLNNTVSAVVMIILGIFFAIFPVYGLAANGILLGYMLETMAQKGINPFQVLAFGIMPHGIFELPAIVIAASLGIRYGSLSARTCFMFWSQTTWSTLKISWVQAIKQFPTVVAVVVLMLFVAAVVESFVTPHIIKTLIGPL